MMELEYCCVLPKNLLPCRLWLRPQQLWFSNHIALGPPRLSKYTRTICPIHHIPQWQSSWMPFEAHVSLNQEPSSLSEGDHGSSDSVDPEGASDEVPQNLVAEELKSLLLDSERNRLLRKLSEANQYSRFLKRQLQTKDDALVSLKNELDLLELELQALTSLAEEVANSGVQPGSRKINGKYIQSHLLSRLQAVHEKVKKNIKEVASVKFKDIALFWVGMAESVQVMGSFDGWSQGENMSPEYYGDYARFSATLKLRPGRYEIKFLVDGEWQLSPELPTVGEGMLKNNLLILE